MAVMPCWSLVYASSASAPTSGAGLRVLLEECRRRNRRTGVTGLLLYHQGSFLQALEGERWVVLDTFACISRDPRHHDVLKLLEEPVRERRFPDWSMGFCDLDGEDVTGRSDFLCGPFTGREFSADPSRAERLLLQFKREAGQRS